MPRTCISSALQRTNNESERKIERERERGTLWGTMNNGAAINWWKWAQIAKYILLFDNIQSLAINRNYNEFAICVCIHICMMWCPWAFWCVRLLYAYACFLCVCVCCVYYVRMIFVDIYTHSDYDVHHLQYLEHHWTVTDDVNRRHIYSIVIKCSQHILNVAMWPMSPFDMTIIQYMYI